MVDDADLLERRQRAVELGPNGLAITSITMAFMLSEPGSIGTSTDSTTMTLQP